MSAPLGVFLAETNSLGVVTGQPVPISTQPFISTLRESVVTGQPVPITTQPFISTLRESVVNSGGSLVPAVATPTLDLTMVNGATDSAASDSTTSSTSSQSPFLSSTSASTSPMISASTLPSLPTSTSRPGPATATASSGLTSSAKIGIGLGVPLGLLILGILGFLILRHWRHRARSRSKHHGNIAAAGPYPAFDEVEMEQKLKSGNTSKVENIDNPKNVKDKVHEIHGTEVPAYARELQGSPGVRRHELPTRRGSA